MSEQSPEKLNQSPEPAETFSLASILAEYKSEAFIRNERRLSKEELEERADEIIREMKKSVEAEIAGEDADDGEAANAAEDGPEATPAAEEAPENSVPEPEKTPEPEPEGEAPSPAETASAPESVPEAPPARETAETTPEPEAEAAPEAEPEPVSEPEPAPEPQPVQKKEPVPIWVPREKRRKQPPPEEAPAEETPAPEEEAAPGPVEEAGTAYSEPSEPTPDEEPTSEAKAAPQPSPEDAASPEPEEDSPSPEDEEDEERRALEEARRAEKEELRRERREQRAEKQRRRQQLREERAQRRREAREEAAREKPEPSAEEAVRLYASGIASVRRRLFIAIVLCAVMAILLLVNAKASPDSMFGGKTAVIVLEALQLAVMVAGLDVLARGVTELLAAKPGFETLVLLANAAAAVDGALILAGRAQGLGLPYCAPAAAALTFALWGSLCRRNAYRDTFKAMRLASVPTAVTAEADLAEEGVVLNKKLGSAKGFIKKSIQPDISERVYRKVTPAVLILLLIFSLAAAFLSGTGAVVHCLAALSCAAAALTGTLVFARPFSLVAKKLIGNGAALAGWGGAEEMSKAVGLVIRDLDVYPENTIILNGMKVLSGAHVEKVVAYTGSVILATGSGLRRVFGELMRQYAAPLYRVEDFDCGTEGGVSAFVGMEQVLVGTGAYMNLMGIRVPGSVDVGGAVYTAIDHELCGVFIVNYLPQELVQNALFRLESGNLRPVFAIRDFNISPAMMTQKFRLSEGSITFLSPEDRYRLSVEPKGEKEPAALLSREGLWHYSETARSGRRLWRSTRRALLMTLLGAVLGVAIAFISCARGAFASVAPGKLLLSMLLWAFATVLIADSAEGD